MNTVTDRFVRATWWVLLMSFIAAATIASIYAAYVGVGHVLAGRAASGSGAILAGLGLGAATGLACRHRTDLMCG